MADDLVLVGAIAGAFGVRGEARVRSFTADPEALFGYGPLLDAGGRVALTPKRWRPIPDGFGVTAPEIASREAAEAMRNTGLFVPRARLPALEEDEFYHVDLVGCRVEGLDGADLGRVRSVQNFGADDLLEVVGEGEAVWFLPFTKAAAPIVDLTVRRIVADPPVGEEA